MGCFLACFGSSEVEKRRRRSHKVQPRDRSYPASKPLQESFSSVNASDTPAVSETRDKPEGQLSLSKRKKVTFDSNVKIHEPVSPHEEDDLLLESENGKKKEEALIKSSPGDSYGKPSFVSYPPNHRYQNCSDENEEDEILDYADSDLDQVDDDEDDDDAGEEYEDFSDDEGNAWKREISRVEVFTEEIDGSTPEKDDGRIGQNRSVRDRSSYVHSVLNPVENLSQWKTVKSRGGALNLKPQKENFTGSLNSKFETDQSNKFEQRIAVDASLSNWLISSETALNNKIRAPPAITTDKKSMLERPLMTVAASSYSFK